MTSDFVLVDEIASKLESAGLTVSISSVKFAKELLENAHKKHITCGRRPVNLAAAALYIASRLEGNRISQQDIAFTFDFSPRAVCGTYQFLVARLGLVLPAVDNKQRKKGRLKFRLQKVLQIIDNCSKKIKDLESKAERELISQIVKDLEAERDSLQLEIKSIADSQEKIKRSNLRETDSSMTCPNCWEPIHDELTECPNCGWHPMPSCAEAYKTP